MDSTYDISMYILDNIDFYRKILLNLTENICKTITKMYGQATSLILFDPQNNAFEEI